MATVILKGKKIYVVCKSRNEYTDKAAVIDVKRGKKLNEEQRKKIEKMVDRLLRRAKITATFKKRSKDRKELEKLTVKGAVKNIERQLLGRKRRSGRRKKVEPKPIEVRPRPTIEIGRIRKWLVETNGASTLHANREYVEEFLSAVENQTLASVAVFNELYNIERFRTYLPIEAVYEKKEFEKLLSVLGEQKLSLKADAETISLATAYLRYYLLKEADKEKGIPRYRKELLQLRDFKQRLAKGSIEGPIDNDTITAAALYLRRWRHEKIAVWKAPAVLKKEKETKAKPSKLEQFAKSHWQGLPERIFRAARDTKPDAIVKLMKNLPEGEKSLEDALKKLKRNDINQAFDMIYNDFFRESDAFVAFVKGLGHEDVGKVLTKLDEKSSDKDRKFMASTIQDFLNDTSTRVDRSWYAKLRGDLGTLYRGVLKLDRDNLDVNGAVDMRTILAAAVYRWRTANLIQPAGEWAKSLDIKPVEIEKRKMKARPIVPF
jgi:hypothetical protein